MNADLTLSDVISLIYDASPTIRHADRSQPAHEDDSLPTLRFAGLARVLVSNVDQMSSSEIADVMGAIERGMTNAAPSVADAVATGFLERLLSDASAGRLTFSTLAPFLGQASREYCQAWDEFTGVLTPGLHG